MILTHRLYKQDILKSFDALDEEYGLECITRNYGDFKVHIRKSFTGLLVLDIEQEVEEE